MADIIVVLILALLIGGAIVFICKSKKKGVNCMGCSHAGSCAKGCEIRTREKNE